jgi:hypothetical protein
MEDLQLSMETESPLAGLAELVVSMAEAVMAEVAPILMALCLLLEVKGEKLGNLIEAGKVGEAHSRFLVFPTDSFLMVLGCGTMVGVAMAPFQLLPTEPHLSSGHYEI